MWQLIFNIANDLLTNSNVPAKKIYVMKDHTVLIKSFISYSFFTILSRISGLIRDIVIARYLGSSVLSDIFFTSFKVPNWFRRTLGDGVMSPAFIPIFAKLFDLNKRQALIFSGTIMVILGAVSTAVTILIYIYASNIITFIAPGFAKSAEIIEQATIILRINAPLLISATIVAIMGGTLTSIHIFAYFAAIPIVLNICMIGVLVTIGDHFMNYSVALSYGVLLGAIVQPLVILYGCYRNQVVPIIAMPIKLDFDISQFFKKTIPVVIGEGAGQMNALIGSIFASFNATGISYIHYTERIVHFITTISGNAIGLASLPMISRKVTLNQMDEASDIQLECISMALFLVIPASATLMLFSNDIAALFYERGGFIAKDTSVVARMLSLYSMTLVFVAVNLVLKTCMFAIGDAKRVMIIGFISIGTNVAINIILFKKIAYYSIMIAANISVIVELILISLCLYFIHNFLHNIRTILKVAMKTTIATCISILSMALMKHYFAHGSIYITVLIIMPIAGLLYIAITDIFGVIKIKRLISSYLAKKKNKEIPQA